MPPSPRYQSLAGVSCRNLSSRAPTPRRIGVDDARSSSLADHATKSLINGVAHGPVLKQTAPS